MLHPDRRGALRPDRSVVNRRGPYPSGCPWRTWNRVTGVIGGTGGNTLSLWSRQCSHDVPAVVTASHDSIDVWCEQPIPNRQRWSLTTCTQVGPSRVHPDRPRGSGGEHLTWVGVVRWVHERKFRRDVVELDTTCDTGQRYSDHVGSGSELHVFRHRRSATTLRSQRVDVPRHR